MITQELIIMGLQSIKESTTNKVEHAIIDDAIKEIKKGVELEKELEQLKRYPTADEVCEALSEFYKWKVSYSNERYNHMFYFEESKLGVLRFMNNGVYFIQSDYHKTNDLPPHLITLIGRFYEGLEKVGKEE